MSRLRGLLNKAKTLAEDRLPPEVLDATRRLRDTVLEHAPEAVSEAIESLSSGEPQPSGSGATSQPPVSDATTPEQAAAAFSARRSDALRRVKDKSREGLKPEDSLVVVYATDEQRDEVARIEQIMTAVNTVLRVMDLDKEPPQTKTQLAKLTGVMVPPYVYINGRHWGAHYEMETLAASGDLQHVVANRLDQLGDEAKRIGKIRETYDDEITVDNIVDRWRMGHILCVDDLDAWFEVEKDGTEKFYYQGGPRPVADMREVAEEITQAVEDEEYEATWQLEPSVAID